MPIVGGYTLDLYCDGPCPKSDAAGYTIVDQYFAHNERECMKQARKSGWKFREDRCICPRCAKQGIKP